MASADWTELLVWKFEGERFDEDGIDLRDLGELVQLRHILVELAKDTWKQQYSARKQITANADAAMQLRFFRTERGSCKVPIYFKHRPQTRLFGEVPIEPEDALPIAAFRLVEAYTELHKAGSVPPSFPTSLLEDLTQLGSSLGDGESASIEVLHEPVGPYVSKMERSRALAFVTVDAAAKSMLTTIVNERKKVRSTVTGEVRMASVNGTARIRVNGKLITVEFTPEQEETVTQALHEHAAVLLRVRGEAEIDLRNGHLRKIKAEKLGIIHPPNHNVWSEASFERLARENPEQLIGIIETGKLAPALLTYAAEIAGKALPSSKVAPILLKLLAHESAVVREGAIYGLAGHAEQRVKDSLRKLAETDSSPAVRMAAAEILKGHEQSAIQNTETEIIS